MPASLLAELYAVLASCLRQPLTADGLAALAELTPVVPVAAELTAVQRAANSARVEPLAQEYQRLFIGIGRGVIVSFASHYISGALFEKPLVHLRQDLQELGFARQIGVTEPEDHIAALCEVLSVLLAEDHCAADAFFMAHLEPFALDFAADMQRSSTSFYAAIAALLAAVVTLHAARPHR